MDDGWEANRGQEGSGALGQSSRQLNSEQREPITKPITYGLSIS